MVIFLGVKLPNKMQIFYLLKELQNKGKTLIVVTHDRELVEIADRVIYL